MSNIQLCLWIVTGLAALNTYLLYKMHVNLSTIAAVVRRKAD